jgi:1-acyl-sn-glycerol-3-phosphate acyltransferase
MRLGACVARSVWLSYWNAMRRYHRYEVVGAEHLDRTGAALIVGYHGRPGARDLCMLQAYLLERNGAVTHAVAHELAWRIPGLRAASEGMEFLPGDGPAMAEAVRRGGKIIVTPGGTREGNRSYREKYKVDWGERVGYLRLALRHRLPIIPTAAAGTDDAFLSLIDGYKLAKRIGLPPQMPLWLGVGAGGVWPATLPFPVRITQHVGAPIRVDTDRDLDLRDRSSLLRMHRRVAQAVQGLLDVATGGRPDAEESREAAEELRWVDQTLEAEASGGPSSSESRAEAGAPSRARLRAIPG